MSPLVYQAFQEICSAEQIKGPILEVGAVSGPDSLLRLPCLEGIDGKTGINMEPVVPDADVRMVCGNANDMKEFANDSFGTVLCNATLEHDPRFWRTVSEIRRVTSPGGLVVIGVPGYRGMGVDYFTNPRSLLGRILKFLAKITGDDTLRAGTVTLGEHFYPGDYYRFTEQAMKEVLLEGLLEVNVRHVMTPPRVIGWGRKP
jgi:SAM-dependent methyltransferase